jgi:hypothetical protein
LYDKNIQTARQVLLAPERSGQRLTSQHLGDAREALGRAVKYMTKEEKQAAEQLFKIASRMKGKTAAEILKSLNDAKLHREIISTVSRVPTLRLPPNS